MVSISVTFQRLPDVKFDRLCYAVGAYVLWAGKSIAKPTYIGEGDILPRLLKHRGRFPRPIDGFVAILGEHDSRTAKRRSEIVEAVLLEIADRVDRYPAHNRRGGKLAYLNKFFASHATVKFVFDGYDPLLEPGTAKPMKAKRLVRIIEVGDHFGAEHNWQTRRRRQTTY